MTIVGRQREPNSINRSAGDKLLRCLHGGFYKVSFEAADLQRACFNGWRWDIWELADDSTDDWLGFKNKLDMVLFDFWISRRLSNFNVCDINELAINDYTKPIVDFECFRDISEDGISTVFQRDKLSARRSKTIIKLLPFDLNSCIGKEEYNEWAPHKIEILLWRFITNIRQVKQAWLFIVLI